MKITNEEKTNTSIEFTIELNADDLEPARLKALERLARDVEIRGFRNGKAPANIVEQHVDPNALATNTLDIAVRRAIPQIFEQHDDLKPISLPHVDIIKYVPGEMAELKVSTDLMPGVELGDYKKLKAHHKQAEISEADVDDVLGRIADNFAESAVVKRAAQNGDEVIIDFTGKKDGVAFDGGTAKDYKLRLGSGQFIPGFEDGLVGHAAGDQVDLNLTFPADYGEASLAGQKVVFETLVKQVNEFKAPAIDDELAKKTGAFQTLADLKEDIRKNLSAQTQRQADEDFKDELLQLLVDSSETEAPATLVEEQAAHIKEDMLRNLQSRGASLEDYLEKEGIKAEEWEAQVKDAADKRVRGSIIVQALADELAIAVADADIDQRLEEMKAVYAKDQDAVKQLSTPEVRANIANHLRIDATIDKLAELNEANAIKEDKQSSKKSEKKTEKKTTKKSSKKSA